MRSIEKNVPERNMRGIMIMLDTVPADSSLFRTAAKIMPSPTNVSVPTRMNTTVMRSMFGCSPKITQAKASETTHGEQRDDGLADDLGDVPLQPGHGCRG